MTHRGPIAVASALVGLGLVLAACGPGFSEAKPTSAIFDSPPWAAEERLLYDFNQRTHLYGTCELTTLVDEVSGTTQLAQLCIDAAESLYHDDRTAVVDSATLRPINSQRVIANDKDSETETKSVTYPDGTGAAEFLSVSGTNEFGATRDLPEPSLDIPNPAWYDDNTLMWLVRGIDLSETDTIDFTDVNPTTVTVFNVELLVEGREQVEVRAGTFDAWKVRLTTKTVTRSIWVDVVAPHRVVKAQVENGTYELAEIVASEE